MLNLSELPQPIVRYGVGLWRRRWTVVAFTWLTALLAWLGLWLIPDTYESRAQVFVQTENILEPVMSDVTARPDYERRVEVMRHALLTRPNVEEIIYRSGLDQTIEASSSLERQVKMEGLINWVAEEITIESPQPMLFSITFGYGDPKIASDVIAAVLDLFIEQDLGASLQENEDAKRKLERQIVRFEERLAAKDQEVARFRREHAEELAIIAGNQRKREQLEANISRIGDELAIAKRSVATLQGLLASTPRTSSGSELDNLKVELAQLRSQYLENHPDIQGLKARIAELEDTSANALPDNPEYVRTRNELRAAQDQVAGLEEREERLRAEQEALSFTIAQAPAVEADLQRIIRDYEQTQKSYDELVQSRDRLDLTTVLGPGSQGVDYNVLERPQPAFTPTSPPRLLLILASVLFAFGAGAAAAMLFTFLDKTYTQTPELQEAFGLPVLGALSEVRSEHVKKERRIDFAKLAAACVALLALAGGYIYWEVLRLPSDVRAPTEEAMTIDQDEIEGEKSWG